MATRADPPRVSGGGPSGPPRPPRIDDEDGHALLLLIAGGDERAREAEAALCRRYAPRIKMYGLRHLRSAEAASDLVQIVLMAVLEAARGGRVREPEHLDRFILGTCRNTSSRMRQRDGRALPTEREDLEKMLVTVEEPEVVDGRALSRCLDRLETRARRVVTMAFREDRSAEEIAAALATTAGNVRVMRHRALGVLRQCLDGKHEEA